MKFRTVCWLVMAALATFCQSGWAATTTFKRADRLPAYLSTAQTTTQKFAELTAARYYRGRLAAVSKASPNLSPRLTVGATSKVTKLDRCERLLNRPYSCANVPADSSAPHVHIAHVYRFLAARSTELPPDFKLSAKEQKIIITQWAEVPFNVGASQTITYDKADHHAHKIYKDRTSGAVGVGLNITVGLQRKRMEAPAIWDGAGEISVRLEQDGVYWSNKTLHPSGKDPRLLAVASEHRPLLPYAGFKREAASLDPHQSYSHVGLSSSLERSRGWAAPLGRSASVMSRHADA